MSQTRPLIAVIGSSETNAHIMDLCERLGAALYEQGLSVLCGGRGGVMEATARGFQQARERARVSGLGEAVVIGLLPWGLEDANPHLDFAIPTGMGLARNALVASGGQAVIAVAGSSGTLSEIALAWQFGKPICALGGSGGWAERLVGEHLDGAGDRRPGTTLALAETPEAAATWAALQAQYQGVPP